MMLKKRSWISHLAAMLPIVCGLALPEVTSAALLISEDFSYDAGALAGNNGGTGWSAGWEMTDPHGTAVVTSDGLSFSDMPVAGGAALMTQTATGFQDVVANRAIGVDVPAGEDLWVSFLYRQPDAPLASNASRTAEVRHSGLKMRIKPKNSGSQGSALRYSSGGATATNGTQNIQSGETFLVVTRFGDVGEATGKVALMWVLDEADYEMVKTLGVSQASLQATSALALSSPHANENLAIGDELLMLVADSSDTGFRAMFDEFRYGTSIEDVVRVVPEPAAGLLAVLGLFATGGVLRSRQI